MNLSNLQPAEGSTHNQNKRLGRGEGSGKGGTLQEVTKEQNLVLVIQRLVLKEGKCHFKDVFLSLVLQTSIKEYEGVNLDTLQLLVDNGIVTDTVDMTTYVANRLATKNEIVKILGRGELKAKLKVTAHKFTATAKLLLKLLRRSCNNVFFNL
jgi:large subunit ribosomal protein L15